MKNVFYFQHINVIGGIETFFYEIARKYCKSYDITIFHKTGDKEQIERLKKYVNVVRYTGQKIECEKCFFNFNLEVIDNVVAKEYIQIIHGDYKAMGIKPQTHPKITKYISVSEIVAKSLKEMTGYESTIIYNPIKVDRPKKVLFLLSATRLTKEKGKNRMIKLGNMLNNAGIPYIWLVFTNDTKAIENQNIIYMKPRLDIRDYIAKSDYFVQLSDNEAYCYSVIEALSLGTPAIVTDVPVFKELGLNETNSFTLDFELSNVDINAIYNKEFDFKYTAPKTAWGKELVRGKSSYNPKEVVKETKQEAIKGDIKVKALFTLNYTEGHYKKNETFYVTRERLEELTTEKNSLKRKVVEICK